MKKVISTIILVTLILSCVLALTACNPQNEIVGTWKQVGYDLSTGNLYQHSQVKCCYDDAVISFNKENTGRDDRNNIFVWKYDKNTKKWNIALSEEDFTNNRIDTCFIDDNGILHIADTTFEKVQ